MGTRQTAQNAISQVLIMGFIIFGGTLQISCGKNESQNREGAQASADALKESVPGKDTQILNGMSEKACPVLSLDSEEDSGESEDEKSESEQRTKPETDKGKGKDKDAQESQTQQCPAKSESSTTMPPATSPTLDGAALYSSLCMSCHGAKANTSIEDQSFAALKASMSSVGAHRNVQMTPDAQLMAISQYLMAP